MNFPLQVLLRQYLFQLCYQPLGANCETVNFPARAGELDIKKRQDGKTEAIKQDNLPLHSNVFSHTEPPHEPSFWGFMHRSYTWAMKCRVVEGYGLNSTNWGTFEVRQNLTHTGVFVFPFKGKTVVAPRIEPATLSTMQCSSPVATMASTVQ